MMARLLILALPLLALLLVIIPLGSAQTTKCAAFVRETCLFSPSLNVGAVRCKPRSCGFPTAEAFECGFAETGSFTVTTAVAPCADPFMDARRVSAPRCGARCCAPDLPGAFSPAGPVPGTDNATRLDYQPYDASCRYAEISRGQVMKSLEKARAPLVVAGDSMMRQLFLRMVAMMRGQHRVVDYGFFANAQYRSCDEADAFRVSGDLWKPPSKAASYGIYNATYTRAALRDFFGGARGPGLAAALRSLDRCATPPVGLDFLFSAEFEHQVVGVPAYVGALPSGVKPVVVLHIGFWEPLMPDVPREYLAMLAGLAKKARAVFIVGVATPLVTTPDTKANFLRRNAFMRDWARRRGAPFHYIEYNHLAEAPGERPSPPYAGDKHYQCRLVWNTKSSVKLAVDASRTGADASGQPLPQVVSGKMERIEVMQDLQCVDEMNRNLAQLVFNAIAATSP